MNKCLILLTSCFPYGTKEPFLENEISFQSKFFDKIFILAQDMNPSAKSPRDIPENAEAFNVAVKDKRIARAGDVFRGSLRFFTPSEACRSDKARIGKSFAKKVFCEYFEQRAHRQFKENLKILNNYDFSGFDEIVIYSYWYFVNCRTGILLKEYFENLGITAKVFSRAHAYDLYEYANRLNYLPLRTYMADNVEKIFTCSEYGCNYMKKLMPDYSDMIECSYLGTIDNGLASYDKTFHIVTCSRTIELKRLDKLVDALASMKESIGEIYWTHIGDGPVQNEIISLSKEKLGFLNYEFIGNLSYTNVQEYYKTHPVNLFVNVSSTEGLPVSIMEALSFGIPVLATDVGGTNETITDGVNGYLLTKDFSNEEFTEKFNLIYNADEEKYRMFRNNARRIWEEKFNAENNYPKFCTAIAGEDVTIN